MSLIPPPSPPSSSNRQSTLADPTEPSPHRGTSENYPDDDGRTKSVHAEAVITDDPDLFHVG